MLTKAHVLKGSTIEQQQLLWTSYGVGSVPEGEGDYTCFVLVVPRLDTLLAEGKVVDTRTSSAPQRGGIMNALLHAAHREDLPCVLVEPPVLMASGNRGEMRVVSTPLAPTAALPRDFLIATLDFEHAANGASMHHVEPYEWGIACASITNGLPQLLDAPRGGYIRTSRALPARLREHFPHAPSNVVLMSPSTPSEAEAAMIMLRTLADLQQRHRLPILLVAHSTSTDLRIFSGLLLRCGWHVAAGAGAGGVWCGACARHAQTLRQAEPRRARRHARAHC